MAEIKVQIKGDDSDIKAKFRETSEEARMFKDAVTKSMDAVGAASKNVISETGLGGILKLLGGAGLAGAAIEFSSRIVDGFKNAVSAAMEFGKQIGQLRSALGGTFGGQAEYWADQIRTISGAMGSFEENIAVFKNLLRGGLVPQDAFKTLIDIQNAAKTLGVDVGELGEKFAEIKERPEEMSRFFRAFPMLAPMARAMGGGETPSVDWMFRTLLPGIAPGGLQAPIRARAEAGVGGQFAAIQEEFRKNWIELGQQLLPVVNEGLRDLKAEMPAITKAFKDLGETISKNIPATTRFLHEFFGTGERIEHPQTGFGKGLKAVNDYLDNVEKGFWNLFADPAKILREAAEEQKKANANLARITQPH